MMWIWIIVIATLIMLKFVSAYDKYQRNHYVPDEELWEKFIRTDAYVPWSHTRRMLYYNRKKRQAVKYVQKSPGYVSYVETGYIHRRF